MGVNNLPFHHLVLECQLHRLVQASPDEKIEEASENKSQTLYDYIAKLCLTYFVGITIRI